MDQAPRHMLAKVLRIGLGSDQIIMVMWIWCAPSEAILHHVPREEYIPGSRQHMGHVYTLIIGHRVFSDARVAPTDK